MSIRIVILVALFIGLLVSLLAPPATWAASGPLNDKLAAGGQSFFNDLTVEAGQTLQGNVIVYNGDAVVKDGGVIQGSLIVYSGNVTVEKGGVIGGNLTVWSGDVAIHGRVDGNISAVSGDVEINDGAVVRGDVSTVSGEIDVERGGRVSGNIVRGPKMGIPNLGAPAPLSILQGLKAPDAQLTPATARTQATLFESLVALIVRMMGAAFVTLLLTGLVSLIYHLRPEVITRAQAEMRDRLAASFGIGLGVNLALSMLIGLLNIICCLLPLAVLPALLLFGLNIIGLTIAARTLGQRLAPAAQTSSGQPVMQVALGGIILVGSLSFFWALTPFLRLPVGLAALIIVAPGVGAFVRQWLNRESWQRAQGGTVAMSSATTTEEPQPSTEKGDLQAETATVTRAASAADAEAARTVSQEGSAPAWVKEALTELAAPMPEASPSVSVDVVAAPPPPMDDFTRIVGIGRTWDVRLKTAGVVTFAQLAAQTPESLADILGITAEQVIEDNLIGQAQALIE